MDHTPAQAEPDPDHRRAIDPGTPLPRETRTWWHSTLSIAVALVIAVAALYVVNLLARPLALLALAIVISSALAPPVDWVGRWLPRVAAVIAVYLLLLLLIAGLGWVIVPPLVAQIQAVIVQLPALLEDAQSLLDRFPGVDMSTLTEVISSQLGEISALLVTLPMAVVSSILEILFVLFMSIYWLIQGPARHRFVLSLLPVGERRGAAEVLAKIGNAMGGYVRGAAINGLIIGALTYVGLLFLGLEYTLVLALFAGVMEVIPIAGPIIASIPIIGLALGESLSRGLMAAGFFVLLQQFEGNLLSPTVMHSQTRLSPLLALLSVFIGGALGGLLGAVVAIPLTAALRVIVVEVVAPFIRRWTGAPREAA
jgi:predicted PurR-regulated permease PerM